MHRQPGELAQWQQPWRSEGIRLGNRSPGLYVRSGAGRFLGLGHHTREPETVKLRPQGRWGPENSHICRALRLAGWPVGGELSLEAGVLAGPRKPLLCGHMAFQRSWAQNPLTIQL